MTWKIGQKLVHAKFGETHTFGHDNTQAVWEAVGWTAAPEPAPVERRLASGWEGRPLDWNWLCDGGCGMQQPTGSVAFVGEEYCCLACAEKAGAFLDAPQVEPPAPATKVTFTDTGSQPGTFGAPAKPCADWCGTYNGCGGSNWCRAAGKAELCRCDSPTCRGLAAKPAPVVESPRCAQNGCGVTDRVAVRYVFKRSPKPMCEECYLECERAIPGTVIYEAVDPAPAARPGLVPQSFGDERIGGVWASRGMR